MSSHRILIVGGGLSGALTALALRRGPAALAHGITAPTVRSATEIVIWDKSRGAGGRMSTSRAVGPAAGSVADIGGQYITISFPGPSPSASTPAPAASPSAPTVASQATTVLGAAVTAGLTNATAASGGGAHAVPPIVSELVAAGVLRPMSGTLVGQRAAAAALPNFVAPAGMSSIVKHAIRESGATFVPSARAMGIELDIEELPASTRRAAGASSSSEGEEDAGGARKWAVTRDNGTVEKFDAVVLTMPVPQVLQLLGDTAALIDGAGVRDALEAVKYSTRFALALWYSPGQWPAVAAAMPGLGRFFTPEESPIIRYVAFDSAKRQVMPESARTTAAAAPAPRSAPPLADVEEVARPATQVYEPCPALLVHTDIAFGQKYADAKTEDVESLLLQQLAQLFPGLPAPSERKCHKWLYSQVVQAYVGPRPYVSDDEPPAPRADGAKPAPVRRTDVGAIMILNDPPLIIAGDAFTTSTFEGCHRSAIVAAQLLLQTMDANFISASITATNASAAAAAESTTSAAAASASVSASASGTSPTVGAGTAADASAQAAAPAPAGGAATGAPSAAASSQALK